MNQLGSQISFYRQNQNMTQEELADRIGITPQAVSKWERGQSLPDATFLKQLCQILHCSADALLGTQQLQEDPASHSQKINHEVMKQLCFSQEPLSLIFGSALVPLFLEDTEQNYTTQISDCRLRLAGQGILMPVVRLRDVLSISPNEFQILSYRRVLYSECIAHPDDQTISHMVEKLYDTVSAHYDKILNRDLVRLITENLGTEYPALISGVVPEKISYRLLYQILKKLWKDGNCFLNLIQIIEITEDLITQTPEMTLGDLVKGIRSELADLQTPIAEEDR